MASYTRYMNEIAPTNDRNRAGEYIGSQLLTLLTSEISGKGGVRTRSRSRARV
jgi:hypothetical protein